MAAAGSLPAAVQQGGPVADETSLQLFLVEHDLHGLSAPQRASAHDALEEAVRREFRHGHQIRYVQRILAPAEHRCLCLFQAPGPDAVRNVNDTAQFPLARIIAVTSSVPHRHPSNPGTQEGPP
jgi:Protein of unknown function (DUF4242)